MARLLTIICFGPTRKTGEGIEANGSTLVLERRSTGSTSCDGPSAAGTCPSVRGSCEGAGVGLHHPNGHLALLVLDFIVDPIGRRLELH